MPREAGVDRSSVRRLLGRYGGVVVAGVGFVISRVFVAEAATFSGGPLPVVATTGSLVGGLAVSVAGVALAVGAFDTAYVTDVSRGCLLGTGVMAVTIAVTVAATGVGMVGEAVGSRLLVANVLLAGAVGGMVNGHRRASLRTRTAAMARGANRARFINRLLRHDVLNAATIIDGHAELLRTDDGDRDRSVDAIRDGADRIESTIQGVGTIAEEREQESVRLSSTIESAVEAADTDDAHGDAVGIDIGADLELKSGSGVAPDGGVTVDADDRLAVAFERIIEHAVDVRGAETVGIETTVGRHDAAVTLVDDGTPLTDRQRDILERGSFPEYDDPTNGFALQAVSLLIGDYDGQIAVANGDPSAEAGGEKTPTRDAGEVSKTDGGETRVTVRLRRASADAAVATVGVPYPDVGRAVAAGLGAGTAMGGVYLLASGVLPVIGALYGVESAAIGWVTHLFHSVVFALLFVAGASTSPVREYVGRPVGTAGVGLAWGVVLWLVAAGVVMPVWLRAVGIVASLPTLPAVGLVAHALWGVTLGAGYVLLGGRFDGRDRPVPPRDDGP